MQVETQPSSGTVISAMAAAYLLTFLAAPVVYFFTAMPLLAITLKIGYAHPQLWQTWLESIAQLLVAGLVLAALQRIFLRKWLPWHAGWLIVSSLAAPVAVYGVWWL